eukprot:7340223-Prymnesium_polylepis.1
MGGCEVHTLRVGLERALRLRNRLSAIELVGYAAHDAAGPELAAAKLTRECSCGLDPRRQNLTKPRSARQEKLQLACGAVRE